MTDNNERIRIEIAFDGQQVLSVLVPISTAEDLDRALAGDHDSAYSFEADDGRYTISLQRVVFVKRWARESRVGFGSVAYLRYLVLRARQPPRRDERGGNAEEGERDQARPCARRAGPEGRPECARGAVPDPFRPDLQLPARQRRQPARRRGSDDADVPEDARGDRQVPLAVGAVLGLALPDRAQPRDGPLPRQQALAAGGGRAGARSRRVDLRRAWCAAGDRAEVDARPDRGSLTRAAAGADAQVRVQLRECGGGDDSRKDRRGDQVASASRARLAPEAAREARSSGLVHGDRSWHRRPGRQRQDVVVHRAHADRRW